MTAVFTIAVAGPDPSRARADVRAILNGSRYKPPKTPRPLKGFVDWLGKGVNWVGRLLAPIGRFIAAIWANTFGLLPPVLMWVFVIAFVVAAIVFLARNVQRHGERRARSTGGAEIDTPHVTSAQELELEAAAAHAAGDYNTAVRLRFRAGLIRLSTDASAIPQRPGLTTREVRGHLQSPRFDGLADTFERVAYAHAEAAETDAQTSGREWPVIVSEAGHGH